MARPRTWTPDHPRIEELLERLAMGESLVRICTDEAMPSFVTVFQMLDEDTEFANRYTRAREIQADVMDHKILQVADELADAEEPGAMSAAARVRIDAYKWRASKLKPKVYGDKVTNEHTGPNGTPIEFVQRISTMTDAEMDAFFASQTPEQLAALQKAWAAIKAIAQKE